MEAKAIFELLLDMIDFERFYQAKTNGDQNYAKGAEYAFQMAALWVSQLPELRDLEEVQTIVNTIKS